ncbi:MAG: hypothetical protein LAT51_13610 [Flavobacteriaceae bacterium]|nr:hypothetical protein [Flavobacteriaceae bacterium]
MRKLFVFIIFYSLYGCVQTSYLTDSSLQHLHDSPVAFEKRFSEVGKYEYDGEIPKKLVLKKVYFQNVEYVGENHKKFKMGECVNKPINNIVLYNFDKSLKSSLKKYTDLKLDAEIFWTNKNLPLEFPFNFFLSGEVKHKDLKLFSELKSNQTVILPLIRTVRDDDKISGQTFIDWGMFNIAFYIFDDKKIYYSRSIVMRKINFIQNSINPKDTQFLQSEWDYLVHEALRPLLEKGVELEIVGRE